MRSRGIYSLFVCIAFTWVSYVNCLFAHGECSQHVKSKEQNLSSVITHSAGFSVNEIHVLRNAMYEVCGLDDNRSLGFRNESLTANEFKSAPVCDLPAEMKEYVLRTELIKDPAGLIYNVKFSDQRNIIFNSSFAISPDGKFILPEGVFVENVVLETLQEGLLFKYSNDEEILLLIIYLSGDIELIVNTIAGDIHFENPGLLCVANDSQYVKGHCSVEEGKSVCDNCSLLLKSGKKTIQARQRQEKKARMKMMFDPAAM